MKPAKFNPLQNERDLAQMSNRPVSHATYINNISRKHYMKHEMMPKVWTNTCLEAITLKVFTFNKTSKLEDFGLYEQ